MTMAPCTAPTGDRVASAESTALRRGFVESGSSAHNFLAPVQQIHYAGRYRAIALCDTEAHRLENGQLRMSLGLFGGV